MSTYLDANEFPAILMAFGYSKGTDVTTEVLAVRAGRVVVRQMTAAQFDAEYVASKIPFAVAIGALESIARNAGRDLVAHRTILSYMNAPVWRLKLVDFQIRLGAILIGRPMPHSKSYGC